MYGSRYVCCEWMCLDLWLGMRVDIICEYTSSWTYEFKCQVHICAEDIREQNLKQHMKPHENIQASAP